MHFKAIGTINYKPILRKGSTTLGLNVLMRWHVIELNCCMQNFPTTLDAKGILSPSTMNLNYSLGISNETHTCEDWFIDDNQVCGIDEPIQANWKWSESTKKCGMFSSQGNFLLIKPLLEITERNDDDFQKNWFLTHL
jgi:hypothetical protein